MEKIITNASNMSKSPVVHLSLIISVLTKMDCLACLLKVKNCPICLHVAILSSVWHEDKKFNSLGLKTQNNSHLYNRNPHILAGGETVDEDEARVVCTALSSLSITVLPVFALHVLHCHPRSQQIQPERTTRTR